MDPSSTGAKRVVALGYLPVENSGTRTFCAGFRTEGSGSDLRRDPGGAAPVMPMPTPNGVLDELEGRPEKKVAGSVPEKGRSDRSLEGHRFFWSRSMDRNTVPRSLTGETLLTVRQSAVLAACSDDTIRRRLDAGMLPGAVQSTTGTREWKIPVSALIAAGMVDAAVLDPSTPAGAARVGVDPEIVALMETVASLTARLDVQEARLRDKDEDIAYLRALAKKLAG